MRIRIQCLFPAVLLALTTIQAATIDWPGHGKIQLQPPAGWKLETRPMDGHGYTIVVTPSAATNALGQITLLEAPLDRPFDETGARQLFDAMIADFVAGSVEQKAEVQPLTTHQGYGWYCRFTDASLVGQAPIPGNFKVMFSVLAIPEPHLSVTATLQFDDPAGLAPMVLLGMVQSLRFERTEPVQRPAPAGAVSISAAGDSYLIGHPASQLTLAVPKAGLAEGTDRIGGGTDSPDYFKLSDASAGLVISGWFEPADRYPGLEKLWQQDSNAAVRGGMPEFKNVRFAKQDGWELISYEHDLGGKGSNVHLRAQLVQAGTWIDLHFSFTSRQAAAAAHAQLLARLKEFKVGLKP